jgi:TolA-binding protein
MRLPSLSAALLGTLVATMAIGVTGSRTARADEVSDVLGNYELEAKSLATDLPRPNENPTPAQRRLVDAQVAYATCDYDAAALVLLELVGTLQGPDAEVATYYLAEALYHKGDRGTASTYFQTLAKNSMSKYYQVALERLVEIAIDQHDMTSGDDWRRQLEGVSQPQPSVPYVLGKYAFAQGKYDDALAKFGAVAKGSDSELQALYYTGTTAVAKKDLAKAIEVFGDLIGRRPRTSVDRRVIELGQLALGRLYY